MIYHTDHLWTIMFLTGKGGKKSAEYSPFGEVLIAKGGRAKHNFYTFTGREYLERLGMYDYRARIYDPRVGRFIEVDQIRERQIIFEQSLEFNTYIKDFSISGSNSGSKDFSISDSKLVGCMSCCLEGTIKLEETMKLPMYTYVDSNPLRYTDPTGMFRYKCGELNSVLKDIVMNELTKIRDSGCVKRKRCEWYYLTNIYNHLEEAISKNKPDLMCKDFGYCGGYKFGKGIYIQSSLVRNAKGDCGRWAVALTLLHEIVHWAWRRGEVRPGSCECRCVDHPNLAIRSKCGSGGCLSPYEDECKNKYNLDCC